MKLGYTIVYVPDVSRPCPFRRGWPQASSCMSLAPTELDTGEMTLAFASHEMGDSHFPGGVVRASESKAPLDGDRAGNHRCRGRVWEGCPEGAAELSAPAASHGEKSDTYAR
jgi:hypothetical protein